MHCSLLSLCIVTFSIVIVAIILILFAWFIVIVVHSSSLYIVIVVYCSLCTKHVSLLLLFIVHCYSFVLCIVIVYCPERSRGFYPLARTFLHWGTKFLTQM